MIRPININLNAAHPELPLVEATTFTGAPSSVFIRGVPKAVGNWSITAVSVAVTYPDNTTTARAAVESAEGVWVATIPGTATSGRTAAGFKIMADGIDENGAAVTGYVLGFADFSVLSFTPVPAPGGTFYLLRYFDQAPATPKKGDVAVVDGLLKMYNGTAWVGFGDGPGFSTDDPQMDGTASPGSAATAARSDHVHPTDTSRASTADATLTDANRWTFTPATFNGYPVEMRIVEFEQAPGYHFYVPYANDTQVAGALYTVEDYPDITSITYPEGGGGYEGTATRPAGNGYVLGSQTDKPLASEAEAVALRTGKMSASATGADILVGGSGGAATSSIASAIDDLLRFKADLDSPTFTGTPVAPTPQDGDNSTLIATTAFVQGAVPYALVTKTITNGAVSLDDRAINAVAVSSALASLTVNFPTATSGKVRDFGLRLTVASGITTAPELALPQGVTCENADGTAPEIGADGAATILYFTETAAGVFLVKGEVVTAIS